MFPATQTSFPSVKSLLSESWTTFTKSILNLFILGIISLVTQAALVGVFLGLGFWKLSYLFSAISLKNFNLVNLITQIKSTDYLILGLMFAGFILTSVIIAATLNIATTIVLANALKPIPLGEVLRKSFALIVPLYITTLISGFFVISGFPLLFLPALLLSYMFMFVTYEVILNEKKYLEALKSSLQIVSQHFGEILLRLFLWFAIYVLILYVVPQSLSKIDETVKLMVTYFSILVNVLFSWYGLSFQFTLYDQSRKATDTTKSVNLTWVWVIAVIGWLLMVAGGFFGYKALKSSVVQKYLSTLNKVKDYEETLKKDQGKITSYAPSDCGLSIPVPNTTDVNQEKERKWLYEQVDLDPGEFYILDKDVHPVEKLLGAFIGYKNTELRLGGKQFSIAFPGLNIICADNYKSLDLEAYKSLALTNKTYKVIVENPVKWGEVELIPVQLEGELRGESIKEPAYIGVSQDGKRLLYIKIWSPEENDPLKTQINSDVDIIIRNLKYHEVKSNLTELVSTPSQTKTPVVPACKQLNIREGEFASNKCYTSKDYDDLVYYLERFNSAAFSYNGAVSSMSITCSGSDFFKNQCEEDKQEKAQVETDMNNYRGTIQGIIAKGK